nr:sigma factor [uncultured Bacteroides sp.]
MAGGDGYEGKGKPSSWIYRVGLNTCISFYRQQQRRGEHTSLDSSVPADVSSAVLEY